MRELLPDISLFHHLETLGSHLTLLVTPGTFRPRLREVANLSSWMYCFLAYVAIRSADSAVTNMLVYARMLKREAQRHRGNG